MHQLQTIEYIEQMNSSVDDKEKMIGFIKGNKVLDAGCGGGLLTFNLNLKGFDAHGIDLSLLSFSEMKKLGLGNKFIHGNLLDMSIYFDEGQFDTILFSSVLHEVYSYTGFNAQNVYDTLMNAKKILTNGGRIIIRDGVKADSNERRRIRFKNVNDIAFLTEYSRRFKGRKIFYRQIDKLTFEMKVNDAMEFLYTYTWGWESFDREVQEQYGVMTLTQYKNLAKQVGLKLVHAEEYLQAGYALHLFDKIEFFDQEMSHATLPNSNMLLVLQKEDYHV